MKSDEYENIAGGYIGEIIKITSKSVRELMEAKYDMFDLGKVIREGEFSNSFSGKGRLTLYEHGIEDDSVETRNNWTNQLKFEGFTSFRVQRVEKGFWVNMHYYRVDYPNSWIRVSKKALRAKGIKYKQPETYRVVE